MRRIRNNFFLWLIIVMIIVSLSNFFSGSLEEGNKIIYSQFLEKVQNREIKIAKVKGNNIYSEDINGVKYVTYVNYPAYEDIFKELKTANSQIEIVQLSNKKSAFWELFLSWLPLLLLFGFYFFRFSAIGGGEGPFSFAKSKAKLLQIKGKFTFEDVAGIDEAKGELVEIVDFLKDPEKYTDIGARIPRGCLLVGPPGTGKTLLAKAIAGEANVPFYFISGSDFVEMFVGVGASRVRDMFAEAKKNAPCIVFIDEIDAVGRKRGVSVSGGNDEREQTLNQLLVEMDGFEGNEGVIVIAATNRDDVLDKALLRPGRFDRQISVQLPDVKGREEILKVHAKKVKIAPNIDLKSVAKSTPNFSGAELANIINEAGLLAARANKKVITNDEIEEAKERVIMGVRNQSKVKKEEETKLIAYHEAGHALVTLNCKNTDPIYKATIISRGNAGGYVARLPENDRHYTTMTKANILDDITISMGGRVAEEIIFGKENITAGALSDIKSATYYAKNMVVSWGMDDEIGAIYCAEKLKSEEGFGNEASSNEMLKLIDTRIKDIIEICKTRAEKIITENKDKLEIIAQALLKYETLSGEEINKIINGEEIRQEEDEGEVVSQNSDFSLFAKITGVENSENSGKGEQDNGNSDGEDCGISNCDASKNSKKESAGDVENTGENGCGKGAKNNICVESSINIAGDKNIENIDRKSAKNVTNIENIDKKNAENIENVEGIGKKGGKNAKNSKNTEKYDGNINNINHENTENTEVYKINLGGENITNENVADNISGESDGNYDGGEGKRSKRVSKNGGKDSRSGKNTTKNDGVDDVVNDMTGDVASDMINDTKKNVRTIAESSAKNDGKKGAKSDAGDSVKNSAESSVENEFENIFEKKGAVDVENSANTEDVSKNDNAGEGENNDKNGDANKNGKKGRVGSGARKNTKSSAKGDNKNDKNDDENDVDFGENFSLFSQMAKNFEGDKKDENNENKN